jgi:hypothetical protein
MLSLISEPESRGATDGLGRWQSDGGDSESGHLHRQLETSAPDRSVLVPPTTASVPRHGVSPRDGKLKPDPQLGQLRLGMQYRKSHEVEL